MRALTGRQTVVLAALVSAALSVLIGVGIANDWRGSPSSGTTAAGLRKQQTTAGPVTVVVTPRSVTSTAATFTVALDNHEIDLSMDLAAGARLTVGSNQWGPARWSGDGPSGHHRSGTLTFAATGPPRGPMVLKLAGLPAPVRFEWALPTEGASS